MARWDRRRRTLRLREEFRHVWEIRQDEERRDGAEYGEQSLEDEYPRPARFAADAIHLCDGSGEEPAEGPGDSRGGEKHSYSGAQLVTPIPTNRKYQVIRPVLVMLRSKLTMTCKTQRRGTTQLPLVQGGTATLRRG